MASKFDIPLHGPSVNIVRQCGSALSDVIESKFGCVATIHGVDFERDPSFALQKRPKVVPEERCAVTLPAGVRVSVWKGDLTSFPADAVVNAANEHLQHYGGLAKALSDAGGPHIQGESDYYMNKHGPLRTGDAVVMDAGLLPNKKIIHAVGPQLQRNPSQRDVSWAEPLLRMAINRILDRVKENRLQSVAIPAISSGLFHYPLSQCADTIVKTVQRYYEKPSGHLPKEILLVNNDEPTVKEMERACHQILTPHVPMSRGGVKTYSQAAAASKGRGDAKTSTASVHIGEVHLTLKKGKIEEQQTDVIVNSIFNKDLSNGQISNAILQKAGKGMQQEIDYAFWSGHVIITKSYNLHCKQVYHTSCTGRGSDTAQQTLYKSVTECLWLAVANHHKSISFPAIGTGGLKFNKKEVAQIMSCAVANFAQNSTMKTEVNFVIFPSDEDTFKAFEEQIRYLQQAASRPSSASPAALEYRDDYQGSRAPTPLISLSGRSDEAVIEAERWLQGLLFFSSDAVIIRNNFIQHFGEREHLKLSRLRKKGVYIEELLDNGHASIIVNGGSDEDVAVVGFQVEAMLCNVQKEFVREEELVMFQMLRNHVTFERKAVDHSTSEFIDRLSDFPKKGPRILKVDRVENPALNMLFHIKKNQLKGSSPRKMFQRIPAQFCEMVCNIGFHAEYAPPEVAAYGEGIYFAGTVKRAMEVWKEPNEEYLYFVEAEVLTGNSTPGKPGLILPPAVGTDPHVMYDSVSGGPDISVIFSTYQALPKYIITCKMG